MSIVSKIRLEGPVVLAVILATSLFATIATAEPLAAPGDVRLRNDLQLLNDTGVINVPMSAWPLALGDIHNALSGTDETTLTSSQETAYSRVREFLNLGLDTRGVKFRLGVSGAENPRVIRSFENTPRDDGELTGSLLWIDNRFSINLSATFVASPFDGDEFRPDGTYLGVALGNWALTAGWQDRWWGPGRDGSLILSINARPTPGIAVQRTVSRPFETKWLRWVGPWTLTSFMNELDDERFVKNALLFGVRGSFRPPRTGLEIGISRTAQWCGDNRPCDADVFFDLLVGNDNRGVNVDPADEPGNQLGGIDIRWTLPKQIPAALYMQWIGEDGRGGGGAVGAWLRQLGVEHWGTVGGLSHRTHFEVSDTRCKQGGFGFSEPKANCAYSHSIYRTGYHYNGRALGHAADSDSLSYSFGSTLVQSAGHSWSTLLRHIEINRDGAPDTQNTLSATPQELTDFQVSHQRRTEFGRFYAGLGVARLRDLISGSSNSDVTAFVQWHSY